MQRVLDSATGPPHTRRCPPHGHVPWPPRGYDSGGFFVSEAIVNRVLCLIDGFNLYHSLRDCERDGCRCLRWLDLRSLCGSLRHTLPRPARIERIVYFSALAHHVEPSRPGTVARHQRYIEALQATQVSVVLGHFKARRVTCPACGRTVLRYEEKETDVAIASRLLAPETFAGYHSILIMTGDTDLVPAVVTAVTCSSPVFVAIAFPYGRVNRQLRQVADATVRLKRAHYMRHQLPMRVTLHGGGAVERPAEWAW